MQLKKIAYSLIGIIALLLVLLSVSIYNIYITDQSKEEKVNNLIIKLEEKYHKDSLNLVKTNKILIDKISQRIIDSVTTVYEQKLELIIQENTKFKNILTKNGITFKGKHLKKEKNKSQKTTKIAKTIPTRKNTNNVTTYSKIRTSTLVKKPSSSNVTTYSKLNSKISNNDYTSVNDNNHSSNVTTYSKLNSNSKPQPLQNSNVTTYTKLKKTSKYNTNTPTTFTEIPKINNSRSRNGLSHGDYDLDHATNFNSVENAPVYPGCENKLTESSKKNCFATKISTFILEHFNANVAKNTNLTKGTKRLRFLFIINKNGKAEVRKIIGTWPEKIQNEVSRVVNTVPRMIPGKIDNNNIVVKYSLKIPFNVY